MNKKSVAKKALLISLCLLALWALLGTGATIAWFSDSTPVAKNSFAIGELSLKVSYKNDKVREYTPVKSDTAVFNDDALYEPGYTQVVYLKIESEGDMDFNYKVAADVHSYVDSINAYGGALHLPKYLRYGVIFAGNEPELERKVAQAQADMEMLELLALNQYSEMDSEIVTAQAPRYAALIIYMPEPVGNEANYVRGMPIPTVKLGLTIYAQQAGTMQP